MSVSLRERFENAKYAVSRILQDTPLEIFLGAALGLAAAIPLSYNHEARRAGCIPLAFSEISQIEKDNSGDIGNMTRYLTSVNDAIMKIFEAWNLANDNVQLEKPEGKDTLEKRFASWLAIKMDKNIDSHRYSLKDFLRGIPEQAKNANESLSDYLSAMNLVQNVNINLDSAWQDKHNDHYHTEIYFDTKTYTDSKGKSHTRTVMKTRQVYDYTIHTYDYNDKAGKMAEEGLNVIFSRHPELSFKESVKTSSKTNKEGEEAARKSRKNEKREEPLTKRELLDISRTWNTGSTFSKYIPNANSSWHGFVQAGKQWPSARLISKSQSYKTYRSRDAGPAEFQIAERAFQEGNSFISAVGKVYGSISQTRDNIPILERKIDGFISTALYDMKGDQEKMMKEIMESAREIYSTNFENGLNTRQFRGWAIALWGLAGLALGGAAGAGIDYTGNRLRIYSKKEDDKESQTSLKFDRWRRL